MRLPDVPKIHFQSPQESLGGRPNHIPSYTHNLRFMQFGSLASLLVWKVTFYMNSEVPISVFDAKNVCMLVYCIYDVGYERRSKSLYCYITAVGFTVDTPVTVGSAIFCLKRRLMFRAHGHRGHNAFIR